MHLPLSHLLQPRSLRRVAFVASVAALVAACRTGPPALGPGVQPVVVPEAYVTARTPADNVDSPAVWHGPDGQHWVLVTAKETDQVLLHDAATGALVRRVGASGTGLGQFERPNGIAVTGDLVFVVERDNARVQVLRLPDLAPVGVFGKDLLQKPYGLWLVPQTTGVRVYVTDNYELPGEVVPPDSLLDRRVRVFDVTTSGSTLEARLVQSIGETSGPGVIRVAESVLVDAALDRLYIAEEDVARSTIKVYGLDGRYAGRELPPHLFPNQAEGLALAACADGSGYLIATDQAPRKSVFHVFDRASLAYRGSFVGRQTANTDGVALTLQPVGPFARGVFYAVDDDAATAAFDWGAVLDALGLPGCPG